MCRKHSLVGAALCLAVVCTVPAMAQVSGAIYTSTSTGNTVNGNNYAARSDVYLNGGPLNCGSGSGLPDGDYFFQVTDPSGGTLLSSDGISFRRVTVAGGVITGVSGAGNHVTGTGHCSGSVSVQLMPFAVTPNPGCVYKVWVTSVADYSTGGFTSGNTKTDNFRTCEGQVVVPPQSTLSGLKFYDADLSGTLTGGDSPIVGWQVNGTAISGALSASYSCTDAGGAYTFFVQNPGSYTITEIAPPPGFVPIPGAIWINTTPTSSTVNVSTAGLTPGPDFGNVCIGAGGGHTLGFWSNRNGAALFEPGDLALMVSLNLRNADGANFNPTSYAAFRTWILNATATNMAYMLSAQLAAMELNVLNGFVNGSALVFAGTNPAGCSVPVNGAGFISVNALMADANTELGTDGLTLAGDPERTCQEFKKNALDAANNNKNFLLTAAQCQALIPSCPYAP